MPPNAEQGRAEAVAKEIVSNIRADADTPYAYALTKEAAAQLILDFAAQQVKEAERRVREEHVVLAEQFEYYGDGEDGKRLAMWIRRQAQEGKE